MKWVTWQNIGIDRMACIWLIRRWIDPQAEFLFVPAGIHSLPKGTEPFDIPGVRYSHHRGQCSFHTLINEKGLKDPILFQIASIIDEADIVQEINVEPVAPALDLLCRGLRQISKDDHEALERGCLLYEAMYAELSESKA
jgi:hypothetical protein